MTDIEMYDRKHAQLNQVKLYFLEKKKKEKKKRKKQRCDIHSISKWFHLKFVLGVLISMTIHTFSIPK